MKAAHHAAVSRFLITAFLCSVFVLNVPSLLEDNSFVVSEKEAAKSEIQESKGESLLKILLTCGVSLDYPIDIGTGFHRDCSDNVSPTGYTHDLELHEAGPPQV